MTVSQPIECGTRSRGVNDDGVNGASGFRLPPVFGPQGSGFGYLFDRRGFEAAPFQEDRKPEASDTGSASKKAAADSAGLNSNAVADSVLQRANRIEVQNR
jgi:hypothetical protein